MTEQSLAHLDDVLSESTMEEILDAVVDNYDGAVVVGYLAEKGTFAGMLTAMAARAAEMKENSSTPMAKSGYVKIKNMLEFTADRLLTLENNIARYGSLEAANRQPHPPPKKRKVAPRPKPVDEPIKRAVSEVDPRRLREQAQAHKQYAVPKKRGRPKGSKNKPKPPVED